MEKKLLFVLMALLLAASLVFVGCDNDPDPTDDPLKPWAPATNPQAPTGYKDFPIEQIVPVMEADGETQQTDEAGDPLFRYNISTFGGGEGGRGYLTDNEDGTYTVGVLTTPGAASTLNFNGGLFVAPGDLGIFKTGYYMLFDFDGDPDYAPQALVSYVSTGNTDSDAVWNNGSDYAVNRAAGAITDTKVYLEGEIALAWENEENGIPYETVGMLLYFPTTAKDGYYTFTLKKILISDDADLTLPYPTTALPQADPPAEPAGWDDFLAVPGVTVDSIFWVDTSLKNITKNDDDSYTVNIGPSFGGKASTHIRIGSLQAPATWEGHYGVLGLPTDGTSAKPTTIYVGRGDSSDGDAFDWGTASYFEASVGSYLSGDYAFYSDGASEGYDSIVIWMYWHPSETQDNVDEFTFTIKDVFYTVAE